MLNINYKTILNVCRNWIVLSAIFFTMQSVGLSQKCNLEINQIDPVTNSVIKRTEDISVGRLNGQPLYFKTQCIGEKKYLKIRYYNYGGFFISEEKPLIVTFTDNSTLELIPRQSGRKKNDVNDLTTVSSLLIFTISKEQSSALKKQPIMLITVNTENDEVVDTEIRERFRTVLQELINCVEL